MLKGHVQIRKGLGLYALARIHQKQRPFTGCKCPGDFIRKIYVPGSVYKIQGIGLFVFSFIWQADGLTFYGNSTLSFYVHVVENLIFKIPIKDNMGHLNQTVGKCRFAMIDMGYNAEISNIFHFVCEFAWAKKTVKVC